MKQPNNIEDRNFTSIQLKNNYGNFTIVAPKTSMTSYEIVDDLFVPLMHALGYHKTSIKDSFEEVNDDGKLD